MKKRRNNKRLGSQREGNLVSVLQRRGYVALRSSLSAGGWNTEQFKERFPEIYKRLDKIVKPIDIIAMKLGEYYFLQVSKHEKDISEDEKTVLDDLAKQAMAQPVLGWINPDNGKWKFVDMWDNKEVKFWK